MSHSVFPDDLYECGMVEIRTPSGTETPLSFEGAVATLRSWSLSLLDIRIDTPEGVSSASGSGAQLIGFLLGRSVVESSWAPKV